MEWNIMTFNLRVNTIFDGINAWPKRVSRVVETIKTINSWIIGTQEALRSMLSDLEKELPDYLWIGDSRMGSKEDEYCAILYAKSMFTLHRKGTFWLSETPDIPGSKSWNSSFPRICTWCELVYNENRKDMLRILNTHLDHKSLKARLMGVQVILDFVEQIEKEKTMPTIIMGDFNDIPGSSTLKKVDTYDSIKNVYHTEFFKYKDIGCTYHDFQGVSEGYPIDYMFYTPDINVMNAYIDRKPIDERYPSDHYPLIIKVDLWR